MIAKQSLGILVVEDDENDVSLLRRAFKKAGLSLPIHVCRDGQEAIDYLVGRGEYADRIKFPFPSLILSDLKMPRCNGLELLQWLRQHPQCDGVPVLILSASGDDGDVRKAYELGASSYFCKPLSIERLIRLIQMAHEYWNEALLPEHKADCKLKDAE